MKLLVILLCLFSERFLVHRASMQRFSWYAAYQKHLLQWVEGKGYTMPTWLQWALVTVPLLLVVLVILWLTASWAWGIVAFVLHLLIFYYCLGPDNAFYPASAPEEGDGQSKVENCLIDANGQLFAPILWYLLLGPIAVLFYRLQTLSMTDSPLQQPSALLRDWMNWIPARMTSLCYLLAGNFQKGYAAYKSLFFTKAQENGQLLASAGMAALSQEESGAATVQQATQLVEQSLVLYLVLCALLVIALWI